MRTRAPLSFATQASYLSAVAHWCHWACVKKFLPFNPAIDLELPKEEHRLPANYLSEIEVELLLKQTDVKTPLGIRDRAIIETVGHFGITMLRRSLPASGNSHNQTRAMDRDATIGRLPAWSGGRDASGYWPPSHADKRRGDAITNVFVLVSASTPCGRATW